jgi:hypothetical protein
MSKKKHCCCEEVRDVRDIRDYRDDCCGSGFQGIDSCLTPIIFLLIACGSGLLNNNRSYLIILLFLLFGGSFGNLFGGAY